MSLISLAVTLIVIGVLLWLVNTYIPMDGKIKKILNVVVVICVVVWLLYAFGILNHSGDIRATVLPVTVTEVLFSISRPLLTVPVVLAKSVTLLRET